MKIQLNNAKIYDPQSSWNQQKVDVLLIDGVITEIGSGLQHTDALQVTAPNLCVAPGFIDYT